MLLNDPFETLPYFGKYKKYLLNQDPKMADVQLLAASAILNRMFLVLCLSKVRDNPLMWAHYTDAHKGFVIGFDASNPLFKPENGMGVDGLKEVQYSEKRNRVPVDDNQPVDDRNLAILGTSITFTKSSEWSYEEEMRILAHPERSNAYIVDGDGSIIYFFDFPSNSVKEIIIGHRSSPALIEKIVSAKVQKYPDAQICKAVLDNVEFKLEIAPFAG